VTRIVQLYQLQLLDSEIDHVKHQLAEVAAQLGESEALKQAKTNHDATQKQHRQAQAKMQDLDLEVKGLAAKIANQEKLLYSGRVLNAKEAANLQEEVAALKRWHSEQEERLLEAMVAAEEAQAAFTTAQAQLSTTETGWRAKQEQLTQKQQELTTQLANLKKRRPDLAIKVDLADLEIYDKLRAKKGGRAVAAVKNEVCQGCGMTPSSNKVRQARTGIDLMYCSVCGRILYVP